MGRPDAVTSTQERLFGPTLDDLINEAGAVVDDAHGKYEPVKTFVLFSGGNDSTAVLHFARSFDPDAAMHINTGIGVEQTRVFVRETCERWNIPLIEECTDPDVYREQVLKAGFPGPAQHAIYYQRLKRVALERVVSRSRTPRTKEKVMLITGVRAYESQRRMGYFGRGVEVKHWMPNVVWVNPFLMFDGHAMNAYRARFEDTDDPVPRNPVADLLHLSGECLCGSFAKEGELEELELWFPETAAYIHALEAEVEAAQRAASVRPDGSLDQRKWARVAPKCQWGWGASDARNGRVAPGPLCNSCVLPGFEEEVADAG